MSSNEPVKNGCEVIYEMFHILNCGFVVIPMGLVLRSIVLG